MKLKNRVFKYVTDCNGLNNHIERLKNTHFGINQLDYGQSFYSDNSVYKYRRPELKKQRYMENVYNCSRAVCDNARMQPFKYICKYFNIKPTEENLREFEKILNNFEAATSGKVLLQREKQRIIKSIEKEMPILIKTFSKKNLEKNLGFHKISLNAISYPKYTFRYISSGGYASTECIVVLNMDNLNRFVQYLSQNIKFKKSIAGQRALMTSSLRKYILKRDNYTCQICGNSIHREPNLLMEIDHIVPLAKGGMTTEDNLQVLCWRCNRKKGAK